MLSGLVLVLVGAGIFALGGTVAHITSAALVVAGIFAMPFLSGFNRSS